MKKRIISIICFALISLLIFAAIPYRQLELKAVDTSKSNEEALKSKITEYKNEQAEIKKKLDSAKTDLASKENEKQYLDSLVLATENEIETTNQLIEEYSTKITETQAEIEVKKVEIDEKYEELLGRMEFVYEEENSENYLDMILNSGTMADMLMTVERIGSMLDFDNSLMSELTAELNALEAQEQTLYDTQAQQKELTGTLKEKEADLKTQLADVETYISDLQSDKEAYEAQMAKAEKAEEEANAEIEKILAQREAERAAKSKTSTSTSTDGGGSPTYTGGAFIWPTVTSYRTITSRFAVGGHRGIDIPYAYGTNVFASKAGTVVTATWHYSYGYYVLIDHGDGSSTLYAHNSKLCVSAGDTVKQGQVIAKGGNTGNSYGNHCHFEVRINGKLVNPLNYVSQP